MKFVPEGEEVNQFGGAQETGPSAQADKTPKGRFKQWLKVIDCNYSIYYIIL